MSVIHVKDRDGSEHTLEARPGLKIMEIIRDAGLPIEAACGGSCACATCHVYVAPGWIARLDPQDDMEVDLLDLADAVTETSRLSCQIEFDETLDGLKVELAPE
ncbi:MULTISPECIES: 2Fe-2S iron-sulfur cluster-binding protein [Roseobacteraceae]|uniref:2Fe-2S iron-sulfur cluster-binding protein n=1 Tax=Roseobacteraceae TaxID=2854170 RepID=UPI001CA9AD40|nr:MULTISPECIES: 2Fe-2S iron-sulfur cluster-binding protein [Roseobacteraceae]UAB91086.1 2Fe-2S iron-sulfur cluster binding domain-containing protein [Ruegeria sp. SCSIO 43209]